MTPTPDPHWIAYLSALLAPLVAIIAAYIAFQNMNTAKQKIKIDLFERRLNIYTRLSKVIENTMWNTDFADEDMPDEEIEYIGIKEEAKWLFDEKMLNWIDVNVGERMREYAFAQHVHINASTAAEATKNQEVANGCRETLGHTLRRMPEQFSPYLRLYKL